MRFVAAVSLVVLAGCAAPTEPLSRNNVVHDPYETTNRKVHAFNRGLDRALVRPASRGYSSLIPDPIEDSIGNFSENLSMPSVVVNGVLQGDLRTAGLATSRFLMNSVLGFGGLFDVATEARIPRAEADFAETLYVWGMPEGAYMELPVIGPSTTRHTLGRFVDLFTNPLSYTLPSPENSYGTVAAVASRLSDRGRYSDTVDSILYESADSYAQLRLIYLQSRRFDLAGSSANATDADPYSDAYTDPYEDPYAE